MKRADKRQALTLIEIIITASLVAIVGLAVFSALDSGLRIWQKLTKSTIEEDVHIFFEKFAIDIRNSFEYKDIDFVGTKREAGFAGLVTSPLEGLRRGPGQIIYKFYPEQGVVTSEKRNLNNIFREKPGLIQKRLEYVEVFRFSYYYYDFLRKEYFWVDKWDEAKLPLAVRVSLAILRDGISYKFTKTFNIPMGSKEL
jgi:hypothetical protein